MKRLLLIALGLAAIAFIPGRADAGGRCKQRAAVAVVQQQQFVATPFFSVAGIGVPVAPQSYLAYQSGAAYSGVGYNYQPRQQVRQQAVYQQGYGVQQAPLQAAPVAGCSACQCQQKAAAAQMTPEQARIAALKAELAALEGGAQAQVQQAVQQVSLVSAVCAKCHSANPTAAGIVTDFSNPDSLTCEQRLAAIGRILSDDPAKRMPKNQALAPEQIGLLIQALSIQPDVPPSPEPDPAPGPQPGEPGVPVPPVPMPPK